jgi:hypothetical protein
MQVDLLRLLLRDHVEIESVFVAAERNDAIIVFDANRPADDDPASSGDEAERAINASALVQRSWRSSRVNVHGKRPGSGRGARPDLAWEGCRCAVGPAAVAVGAQSSASL